MRSWWKTSNASVCLIPSMEKERILRIERELALDKRMVVVTRIVAAAT